MEGSVSRVVTKWEGEVATSSAPVVVRVIGEGRENRRLSSSVDGVHKRGQIPDPDVKIAKPMIAHDVDD